MNDNSWLIMIDDYWWYISFAKGDLTWEHHLMMKHSLFLQCLIAEGWVSVTWIPHSDKRWGSSLEKGFAYWTLLLLLLLWLCRGGGGGGGGGLRRRFFFVLFFLPETGRCFTCKNRCLSKKPGLMPLPPNRFIWNILENNTTAWLRTSCFKCHAKLPMNLQYSTKLLHENSWLLKSSD